MLALASVDRNARYWQGMGSGLWSDNKGSGDVKIKDKGWWNEPLLRLDGRSACPPELAARPQNRVHSGS